MSNENPKGTVRKNLFYFNRDSYFDGIFKHPRAGQQLGLAALQ
jgi:hypothetical protein